MKILQVHDAGFVGRDLKPALEDLGVQVEFLPLTSTIDTGRKIRKSDCDLVHAHYARSPAYAAFLSGKPYVVSAHGDDLRWGTNPAQKLALSKARKIFYHITEFDSIFQGNSKAVYVPRPVDLKRFPFEPKHEINRAIFFQVVTADLRLRRGEEIFIEGHKRFCSALNIELVVREKKGIPDMQKFLSNFELLFDIRNCPDYSKTGLEAQAMGLYVLGAGNSEWPNADHRLEIREGLEKSNSPKIIAQKLVKEYEKALG